MQQQIVNNNNVHIKVQCENEFRRFVLSEVTYSSLAGIIQGLLGFPSDAVFKLSYLDDESDWVLFATDSELQYAVTLSKSPLKILVKLCSAAPATPTFVPTTEGCLREDKPWKGRGGRRGGRGGCQRGEWNERIDAKIARLTERHAFLTAKMIESDLSEEKARGLEWRISHLQNKIDSLKMKKQQLADVCAESKQEHQTEAPVQETVHDATTPHPPCHATAEDEGFHHCHGRRGGRGCWGEGGGRWGAHHGAHHGAGGCHSPDDVREKKCGAAVAFACNTPEGKAAFDRFVAAKEAVMTARREKAGKEEIIAKIEELKEAKADWKDIKLALWKESRATGGCPRKAAK